MAAQTTNLPTRAGTNTSSFSEDPIPDFDPATTAGLLEERLQAWKHACGYLEDYVSALEKIYGKHAKEYERALKTISSPLKEGQHFDQTLGGIAGVFENMRSNTQALINTNLETEKSLKGSVLNILERLHKEIKHKAKELESGAGKASKEIAKLRNTTQKHIELLGSQTATFGSAGGNIKSEDDPYIVQRGILHRLNNQVEAENNHHNDLLAQQSNFKQFEAHVVEVFQQAIEALTQLTVGQAHKTSALHNDMLGTVQAIPRNFEWDNFTSRCGDRLANPNDPARSVDAIQFANMDHPATKALIEGTLERKSRNKLSWGYSTGYYVVTPSKFLHEFKDSDNVRNDPKPELSIYLPDASIGSPNGEKFNVKGKDKSKSISSKLTGSSELAFKAHTAAEAQKWFQVISEVAGATGPMEADSPPGTAPTTPAVEHAPAMQDHPNTVQDHPSDALKMNPPSEIPQTDGSHSVQAEPEHKLQEEGITAGDKATEPAVAKETNP